MAVSPTQSEGNIRRNILERVNKAFLIPSEQLVRAHGFDSEDGGTFGYKTAVWGYPRGDVVSIIRPDQDDQDVFIFECEKVLELHKNFWIRNPYILEVYGISCINNQLCLVMEQVSFPLSAVLSHSAPQRESLRVVFDNKNAFDTAVDIIIGLKYLHSQHIVHCALSPENVALVVGEQFQIEGDGKRIIITREFKRAKIVVTSRTCKEVSQWTAPGPYNASLLHYIPEEYHNTNYPLKAHKGVDIYSYAMILEEIAKSHEPHNEHLQYQIAQEIKESYRQVVQNKQQLPASSTGLKTAEEIHLTLCRNLNVQEQLDFGQSEEVTLRENHMVFNNFHHKLDEVRTHDQKLNTASNISKTEIHVEVPATNTGESVTSTPSTVGAETASQPGFFAKVKNSIKEKLPTRQPSRTREQFLSDLS